MKIQENFGWLNVSLTDPSKTYVIGGSEEANERERQKYLGADYQFIPSPLQSFILCMTGTMMMPGMIT